MSQSGYDNNNRGACWPLEKTHSVQAEIEHRKFHGVLARTGAKSEKAPSHNLFLRAEDNRNEVYCVAIFRHTKSGSEKLAGGELSLLSGHSFWVALFLNKSQHPNSPAVDLSFTPKERQEPAEAATYEPDDDVPF